MSLIEKVVAMVTVTAYIAAVVFIPGEFKKRGTEMRKMSSQCTVVLKYQPSPDEQNAFELFGEADQKLRDCIREAIEKFQRDNPLGKDFVLEVRGV